MSQIAQKSTKLPWLLYAYPWMPYPRRIAIYLAEKRIPSEVVQIVHVTDPYAGNHVVPSQADKYPPRPEGSLPVLAIQSGDPSAWLHIRQSMAIMEYLEEATAPNGELSNVGARELRKGRDALERAREREVLGLAEELTISWNPVRTFGTKAGTMVYPEGAKEMYRWVHRTLNTVNLLLAEKKSDFKDLADDDSPVSIADIVLFQFLEFTDDCYGVDVTQGSGEDKTDVYGRVKKEEYPALRMWYQAFKQRKSAQRLGEGESVPQTVLANMQYWYPGSM